jgi:hypothetical protein
LGATTSNHCASVGFPFALFGFNQFVPPRLHISSHPSPTCPLQERLLHTVIHTRPLLNLTCLIIRPHPPMPIELAMVQEKRRLVRRDIYIAARIAAYNPILSATHLGNETNARQRTRLTDTKVPAAMEASKRRPILQTILKRQNVSARRDVRQQIRWLEPLRREEIVHVAPVAAGIVAVSVCPGVRFDAEFGIHGRS